MLPPVHKMRQQVESIPDYPGRAQVEAVTGPLVEFVAGKWVRRYAERQVLRLVGYHEVWHALAAQGCKMPGREMVRRGIVRGGKTEYDMSMDFELLFGAPVGEMTHAEVLSRLSVDQPPIPGQLERPRVRRSAIKSAHDAGGDRHASTQQATPTEDVAAR